MSEVVGVLDRRYWELELKLASIADRLGTSIEGLFENYDFLDMFSQKLVFDLSEEQNIICDKLECAQTVKNNVVQLDEK